MASDGEGRIRLLSPKRHSMGAPPASSMTILRPENPLTAQATTTIPPWQGTPWSDTDLPLSDGVLVGTPHNYGAT
jgi:hypothetical protein